MGNNSSYYRGNIYFRQVIWPRHIKKVDKTRGQGKTLKKHRDNTFFTDLLESLKEVREIQAGRLKPASIVIIVKTSKVPKIAKSSKFPKSSKFSKTDGAPKLPKSAKISKIGKSSKFSKTTKVSKTAKTDKPIS